MHQTSRRFLSVIATSCAVAAGLLVPAAAANAVTRDPVVLVAGTFSPAFASEPMARRLRNDGYSVTIFELPTLGTQDINKSAQALGAFVDGVRSRTGAAKVDLIAHSQGGLVSRAYIKNHGGATKIDSNIMLGTPNQGTSIANIINFWAKCAGVVACNQMAVGSAFLNDLNAGDDTIGSVRYTSIRTLQDELVRPVNNARLNDGTVNVLIQSKCWARVVGHVGLIIDGTVYSAARQALEGRTSISPNCFAV